MNPLEQLRHHVSGAIERGEKEAVEETPVRRIAQTFGTVTPESAEYGDYDEQGWIDEEGVSMEPDKYDREVEGLTAVDLAVAYLEERGVSPSSSEFHPGVWYTTTDPERDYETGAETYYGFHLRGFSTAEEEEVFNRITR